MLSNQHFYHRITRKMVVAFGTMFNNIRLVRYNKTNTVEIERIIVPLSYADKEKFYKRITQDPELTKETAITLPRMGFTLDSITYDPLRKTSIFNNSFAPSPSGGLQTTNATPYNFNFTLSIYVRNVEDGTQIVEQILPYFNPDYTLSMALTNVPSLKNEVPIILESVTQNMDSEGGSGETRVITWDLNFTMKGYFYGPVSANGKVIKTSTANTFLYKTDSGSSIELDLTNGTGSYKNGELVYQGYSINESTATGFVESWSSTSNTLVIVDATGQIKSGKNIIGAVTGASWNVNAYTSDYKVVNIKVQPDPLTANAGDDFGFTETITEYIW